MANRNVSDGRKLIYTLGQILVVAGVLTLLSVIATGAMLFAVPGMAMFMSGSVLMVVGRAGLAGSGVVLDPERAREDLEPWARMAGGMMKDGLDEAGIVVGTPAGKRADFAERLRELYALHQEGILSDEEYEREKAEVLERS